jgi:hypothetical protein
MKKLYTLLILWLPLQLWAQYQNVMITNLVNPNEPSIVIDPKQPNVMLAGSNLRSYYVSLDSGLTWTQNQMSSSYGVWGDPALIVDTASNFYFFHLSNPPSGNWIDRIVCQKTTNNGSTWSDGSYMGLNGTKAQDKEWGIVDQRNNNIYVTWTQFDDYGSTNSLDSSVIMFSKSLDGGDTWSEAKRINKIAGDCIDSDNTTEGAVPAVGPDGEIYVAWAGPSGLTFNRSLDEGETWLETEIFIDPMPTGWDYGIPDISRANGLPVTVCDLSGGPNHGTIYVNWSDQRNGDDDTDIWIAKSTDGGDTWETTKRVNDDDPGKQQFFTWMAIDQTTGFLYFVFYDRREHEDTATDVYMAISDDGGETFNNFKISETPFVPNAGVFFGDYTNISVTNGIVRPIWIHLNNGSLSLWTAIINFDVATGIDEQLAEPSFELFQNYPNPATDETFVSFKLHEAANVTITINNALGQLMAQPILNKVYHYGKHVVRIPVIEFEPGIYYYSLQIGERIDTRKLIVE